MVETERVDYNKEDISWEGELRLPLEVHSAAFLPRTFVIFSDIPFNLWCVFYRAVIAWEIVVGWLPLRLCVYTKRVNIRSIGTYSAITRHPIT